MATGVPGIFGSVDVTHVNGRVYTAPLHRDELHANVMRGLGWFINTWFGGKRASGPPASVRLKSSLGVVGMTGSGGAVGIC